MVSLVFAPPPLPLLGNVMKLLVLAWHMRGRGGASRAYPGPPLGGGGQDTRGDRYSPPPSPFSSFLYQLSYKLHFKILKV